MDNVNSNMQILRKNVKKNSRNQQYCNKNYEWNVFDRLIRTLDIAKERINDFGRYVSTNSQTEMEREKEWKTRKKEKNSQELRDNFKNLTYA